MTLIAPSSGGIFPHMLLTVSAGAVEVHQGTQDERTVSLLHVSSRTPNIYLSIYLSLPSRALLKA